MTVFPSFVHLPPADCFVIFTKHKQTHANLFQTIYSGNVLDSKTFLWTEDVTILFF